MRDNNRHIFLIKANDQLVSHCHCGDGLIASPAQMDCPWCGCGWLFTCRSCRKAFAFARGVLVDETWEETATRDLQKIWKREPSPEDVESWVDAMKELLTDVVAGCEYVYLDGSIIPSSQDAVSFEGWHSRHTLPHLPHTKALSDDSVMQSILSNPEYWNSNAIPGDEVD